MITGDYPETALAIARQVKLAHNNEVLTGQDILSISKEDLQKKVNQVNIYSRMFPEAKLKVIEALKANGEIVAIKTEKTNLKYKMLKHEVTILNYLFRNHCKLIPFIYWYGVHFNHTCIIMTYYSHSLQDYFNSKGIVDTSKLCSIMIKCIDILVHPE